MELFQQLRAFLGHVSKMLMDLNLGHRVEAKKKIMFYTEKAFFNRDQPELYTRRALSDFKYYFIFLSR